MAIAELIERSQTALKNVKEKKQTVINFEEIEMGIQNATSLGLTGHVEHYKAEKCRKIFESYEFPKISLDDAVKELTGYRNVYTYENNRFSRTKDIKSGENISVFDTDYVDWACFRTIAMVRPVENLKSHIPAPILDAMIRIKNLGLVNGFCAVGFPNSFVLPKADPIILAYISDNTLHNHRYTDQNNTFYFVGKYN